MLRYLPLDSNDEGDLGLGLNEERSLSFSISLVLDQLGVHLEVLVVILLSISGGNLSSLGSLLLGRSSLVLKCFENLSVSFLLFKNVFWDNPGS